MSPSARYRPDPEQSVCLSDLYDEALPEVYGYLRRRCGSIELAEELTSATFVTAAMQQSAGRAPGPLTVGWLITVARNKLIDHWRRQAVAERSMTLLEGGAVGVDDPWDEVLDIDRSHRVLADLPPHYRLALTLRYLDDLSVPEVATLVDRSVRATESLLVRARTAFRERYEQTDDSSDGGPDRTDDRSEGRDR